jgi:hypothetical protein
LLWYAISAATASRGPRTRCYTPKLLACCLLAACLLHACCRERLSWSTHPLVLVLGGQAGQLVQGGLPAAAVLAWPGPGSHPKTCTSAWFWANVLRYIRHPKPRTPFPCHSSPLALPCRTCRTCPAPAACIQTPIRVSSALYSMHPDPNPAPLPSLCSICRGNYTCAKETGGPAGLRGQASLALFP